MGVRLRRGNSSPKIRTALVDIRTPGAGPVGVEHGFGMTESQRTGDRPLIPQTSSVTGATRGPGANGGAE
jgi:hypothetical protein